MTCSTLGVPARTFRSVRSVDITLRATLAICNSRTLPAPQIRAICWAGKAAGELLRLQRQRERLALCLVLKRVATSCHACWTRRRVHACQHGHDAHHGAPFSASLSRRRCRIATSFTDNSHPRYIWQAGIATGSTGAWRCRRRPPRSQHPGGQQWPPAMGRWAFLATQH